MSADYSIFSTFKAATATVALNAARQTYLPQKVHVSGLSTREPWRESRGTYVWGHPRLRANCYVTVLADRVVASLPYLNNHNAIVYHCAEYRNVTRTDEALQVDTIEYYVRRHNASVIPWPSMRTLCVM